jgi:hypothetical protein
LDLKFKEPTGARIGFGLRAYAFSVNLEYEDLNYNTSEIESLGSLQINNQTNVDYNSYGYSLSMSFPLLL